MDGADAIEAFRAGIAHKMQKMLGLRTKAEIVSKGTLPRTDFKARRVIDDRAAFREMNAQLAAERSE
jgi:phenylacetate-CoA ligase